MKTRLTWRLDWRLLYGETFVLPYKAYASNQFTLHRSDKAAWSACLDPRFIMYVVNVWKTSLGHFVLNIREVKQVPLHTVRRWYRRWVNKSISYKATAEVINLFSVSSSRWLCLTSLLYEHKNADYFLLFFWRSWINLISWIFRNKSFINKKQTPFFLE